MYYVCNYFVLLPLRFRKDVELTKIARERFNNAAREAKKAAKKEAARNKELAR